MSTYLTMEKAVPKVCVQTIFEFIAEFKLQSF
jgi:hypothetical protein